MQDVSRDDGRTVLFVSHNMTAVKNLCLTCILLEKGTLVKKGDASSIIELYLKDDKRSENCFYPKNSFVKKIAAIQEGDKIIFSLIYDSKEYIKQPNFGFVLYDNYDNPLFGTNAIMNGIIDFGEPKNKGEVIVTISSPYLVDGKYPISIWFGDGKNYERQHFNKEKCVYLNISNMNNSFIEKVPTVHGPLIPICKWEFL